LLDRKSCSEFGSNAARRAVGCCWCADDTGGDGRTGTKPDARCKRQSAIRTRRTLRCAFIFMIGRFKFKQKVDVYDYESSSRDADERRAFPRSLAAPFRLEPQRSCWELTFVSFSSDSRKQKHKGTNQNDPRHKNETVDTEAVGHVTRVRSDR